MYSRRVKLSRIILIKDKNFKLKTYVKYGNKKFAKKKEQLHKSEKLFIRVYF